MSLIFISLTNIRSNRVFSRKSKFKSQSKSLNKLNRWSSYNLNLLPSRKFSNKHRKTLIGPKSITDIDEYFSSTSKETPEHLNVKVHGHGDEIFVMIHGIGSNSDYWIPLINKMNLSKTKVYCPDLLGHGMSSFVPYSNYTPSTHLHFLERDLTSKLNFSTKRKNVSRSFHLIGCDLGSVLAIELATKSPTMVKSLTLLSLPIYFSEREAAKDLLSQLVHPKLKMERTSCLISWYIPYINEKIREYMLKNKYGRSYINPTILKLQAMTSSYDECIIKHRIEPFIDFLSQKPNPINLIENNSGMRRNINLKKIADRYPNIEIKHFDYSMKDLIRSDEFFEYLQSKIPNE